MMSARDAGTDEDINGRNKMSADTTEPCAYCGTTERARGIHSNVAECQRCWDWRKLDGPAARHWVRVGREWLSNIDIHDLSNFMPSLLGDEDAGPQLIQQVLRFTARCELMMVRHRELKLEDAEILLWDIDRCVRQAYTLEPCGDGAEHPPHDNCPGYQI